VSNPKYSIVLPVHNGMPYLKTAVASVLSCTRTDFELIVSDDHSSDGSIEFLESIVDTRLRFIKSSKKLSMAEHWEWALSHSAGMWVMFLGQDDALQGYFFELADSLTLEASRRSLRTIAARRAYIFWPGCEDKFAERIQYFGLNRTSVRNTSREILRSLFFGKKYHELPQMYTNSLFHRSILEDARKLQNGRVFVCHPQDANLAALALLLERSYLRSEIPLGWVGTSPSSAGLAISLANSTGESAPTSSLADEYAKTVEDSAIRYPKFAGDFSLASEEVYLWQALVLSSKLSNRANARMFTNKFFMWVFFSSVLGQHADSWKRGPRIRVFQAILRNNGVSSSLVAVGSIFFRLFFGLKSEFRKLVTWIIVSQKVKPVGLAGFSILAHETLKIEIENLNSRTQDIFQRMTNSRL